MATVLVHALHGLKRVEDDEGWRRAFGKKYGIPLKNVNQLVLKTTGPRGKPRGEAEVWRRVEDLRWLRRADSPKEIVPVLWIQLTDFIHDVATKRADMPFFQKNSADDLARLLNDKLMTGSGPNRRRVFVMTEFKWEKAPAPANAAQLLEMAAAALWPASGYGIRLDSQVKAASHRRSPLPLLLLPARPRRRCRCGRIWLIPALPAAQMPPAGLQTGAASMASVSGGVAAAGWQAWLAAVSNDRAARSP